MTSKPFKRKLKSYRHGVRYYRLWGWPLREDNVLSHQRDAEIDPCKIVWKHPQFGWLTLHVFEEYVGSAHRKYRGLTNSVDGRYFSKKSAGIRVLEDYLSGRTHAGLANMVAYHGDCERSYLDFASAFEHEPTSEVNFYAFA